MVGSNPMLGVRWGVRRESDVETGMLLELSGQLAEHSQLVRDSVSKHRVERV